jgi:Ser/Thr protein kinase RdoA (MazF antagonist)
MADFQAIAEAALARYALQGANARIINISENATFRVDTANGDRFALRIHRENYHTKAAIASELAWVTALRAAGDVVTAKPIHGRDCELIQEVVGRMAVLFGWETGAEPAEDNLHQSFPALGRAAAQLHRHARSWQRPAGFERLTWDFDGAFGARGHWGDWREGMGMDAAKAALFARALDLIRRRLDAYGKSAARFGLVHCDMRLANLLIDGETTKVIDFDDCGFSWYLYDCATALSFIEHRPDAADLVAAWVKGYREVEPLSLQDEAEIPTFILFRRLLLVAWIGSHAETDLAKSMGVPYTEQSVALCEGYLKRLG